MIPEKTSSIIDLLTAIQEGWNYFDKEYCFKFMKYIPEKIEPIIKSSRGGN